MRLVLHADSPADFEKWRRQQLQPGREPSTDAERRGRQVFTSASCVLCHSVQGTDASATVGPDLTHLGSRGMIAAGTLPNTPGNLATWITAPQRLKPGAQMPATKLPPDDLGALTQYLASLQ
jgi:cytochrome c oxidase subunit 2